MGGIFIREKLTMLYSVLLAGCVLLGQADAEEVRRLVSELDSRQLATRKAAEEKLLELGGDVLDLLPASTARTSAEVKQRIGRIRQKLQHRAAESAVNGSLVTLSGEMPLSKILAAMEKQTDNKIVDFRRRFGHEVTNPKLNVEFDKTPFWQALDRVLDDARLTTYPYGKLQAIHVIGRNDEQLPRSGRASYAGPFRFEPVSITARRDLRYQAHRSLRLNLQAAWEPRLRPICLKQKMADLRAVDENSRPLAIGDELAELEIPVGADATAVEIVLPWKLPNGRVRKIAKLRGTLTALVPGKVETFTFDDLPKAENVEKRTAGVTVELERVRKSGKLWEVRIRVRFDDAKGALASHRGWILGNECCLETPDGKPVPYKTVEITHQGDNQIGLAYFFSADRPLGEYRFVYKTPGVIVSAKYEYEFEFSPGVHAGKISPHRRSG